MLQSLSTREVDITGSAPYPYASSGDVSLEMVRDAPLTRSLCSRLSQTQSHSYQVNTFGQTFTETQAGGRNVQQTVSTVPRFPWLRFMPM